MEGQSRREFVVSTLGACALCSLASCTPKGAVGAESPEPVLGPVDVGPLSSLTSKNRIRSDWASLGGFFLVREGNRVVAVSSTCTHRRVRLVASGDGRAFKCPRHGSVFQDDGRVTVGPATKPLPRFAIRVDERGHVLVDPSRRFGHSEWNDPGSYIEV